MKNLSIIINVVLFIAVIVLYVLHFTSGRSTESAEGKMTNIETDLGPSSIVYVNEDTLLGKYDFFKIELARLEGKKAQSEQDYSNRAAGLQSEIENFQRTAANMTINQARAVEEDLMRKQQNLLKYQETLSQDLMQEEVRLNTELYNKVAGFLKEYAAENNYSIVLNFRRGNALMYIEEGMDITNHVVSRLNEQYAKGEQPAPGGTDTE
ncbi:OmpH family outer membrane protein [Bacteroidota bacterium]